MHASSDSVLFMGTLSPLFRSVTLRDSCDVTVTVSKMLL